jgi:hypothetical protein
MAKAKGRVFNKIAVVMKSGEPIKVEQFEKIFGGTKVEPVLYRLSTYIWNIKRIGGTVRVHKDGRRVEAYQLMNGNEFDNDGFYVGKVK